MSINYLQEGPLTKYGTNVQTIIENIRTSGVESIFEILTFLMKSKYKSLTPNELSVIHMKRSADKIIEDNYFSCCTDYGLVFCILARAKNIPTKFMHYLDLNQFKIDPKNLSLHVFCECYIDSLTILVDPQKGIVQNILGEPDYRHLLKRNGKNYILGYEGLDNADANILSELDLLNHMTQLGNISLEK